MTPSIYSVVFADATAIGHINAGFAQYRELAAWIDEKKPTDLQKLLELGVPAITNMALGLELLVKIHHFQLSGKYPKGHDMGALGLKYPEETLQILRGSYLSLKQNPVYSDAYEIKLTGGIRGANHDVDWPADAATYDDAMRQVGEQYVRWRYIYEEFGDTIGITLAFAQLRILIECLLTLVRSHDGNAKVTLGDPQ